MVGVGTHPFCTFGIRIKLQQVLRRDRSFIWLEAVLLNITAGKSELDITRGVQGLPPFLLTSAVTAVPTWRDGIIEKPLWEDLSRRGKQ